LRSHTDCICLTRTGFCDFQLQPEVIAAHKSENLTIP
jgi:hypothetical protein